MQHSKPVLARYLTVAGSGIANPELTVDITDESDPWRLNAFLLATCRGCPWTHQVRIGSYSDDTAEDRATHTAAALQEARPVAQQHAEICRAMPANT
ncbi:hypothetical protein ACGF0D_10670 [Kitasatospora sp. NPDC048298]|uniref:hypothetical protein n=1 Tax=Kitasatospora sp. NPDC048298 TaxID=3364049 RepID=UPI0037105FDB